MTRLIGVLFALVMLGHTAWADVCVTIDEQRDTLSPEDRRAAAISFGQALAKNGVVVTNTNCTQTYIVYNVKLGDTISVYVTGPAGNREARAKKLDELPLVYEQIAHSLVTGEPLGTGGDNVDRTNATVDQMAPRRVGSDNVKFVRLGYGGIRANASGPAFGFGWRFELDRIGVEISCCDIILATDSNSRSSGVTGTWLRLSSYYFLDPLANSTTYAGGGLGWGGSAVFDNSTDYGGSGLQGTLTVGYETLRSSTLRLFVEATATLPFYTSGNGSGGRLYIPSVALQVGIGWGKSNTIQVVNR